MKKIIVTFLLTVLVMGALVYAVLPLTLFAPQGTPGAYSMISGLISCNSTWSCLHETGHAMDYRLGRPSQSKAFIDTVNYYLTIDTMYSAKIRWFFGWLKQPAFMFSYNRYSELYAEMYMWSSGYKDNMPLDFQKFYEWDSNDATWQVNP